MHWRRNPGIVCFFPSCCAKAPAIPRDKAGKLIHWIRGRQIIPATLAEFKKFGRDLNAHNVQACVLRPCITATIPIEAGHGVRAANHQIRTEYIFTCHKKPLQTLPSIASCHFHTATHDLAIAHRKVPSGMTGRFVDGCLLSSEYPRKHSGKTQYRADRPAVRPNQNDRIIETLQFSRIRYIGLHRDVVLNGPSSTYPTAQAFTEVDNASV